MSHENVETIARLYNEFLSRPQQLPAPRLVLGALDLRAAAPSGRLGQVRLRQPRRMHQRRPRPCPEKCIFERAAHGLLTFRAKYGQGPNYDYAMRRCVRRYTGF
jgi:hypothetical protein